MAKHEEYARTIAYRFYVADSLMLLPQHGAHLSKSLREVYYHKAVDNRTGDEIAEDIIKRAGLRFKE